MTESGGCEGAPCATKKASPFGSAPKDPIPKQTVIPDTKQEIRILLNEYFLFFIRLYPFLTFPPLFVMESVTEFVMELRVGNTSFFLENQGEGVLDSQALETPAFPLYPEPPPQEERVWVWLWMEREVLARAPPGQASKGLVECW